MASFAYKALDKKGKEITGSVDAENTSQAITKIREKGYYPTTVNEARGEAKITKVPGRAAKKSKGLHMAITIPGLGGRVKPKELTLFTRQLATLVDAGLPLVRSLNVLSEQAKPGTLKDSISAVAGDIEGGNTFSESLQKHPKVFNKLFVNMVRAGEAGGVLEVVLERLAEFSEKSQKLAGRVKSAMVYPAVVLCFAGAVLTGLITFILPKFMEIFKDVDVEMPGLTVFMMNLSYFLRHQWYYGVGGIVTVIVAYKLLSRHPKVKYLLDVLKLNMPIFGQLLRKIAVSRFARTLGTLLNSGVQILQALAIVKDTAGNDVIANAIGSVHDSIREGESIAAPLAASKAFPPLVTSMIEVGEETGNLDQMLLKIADTYDEEVDSMVAGLTSLLEPILIVGMGTIVGAIVVAMFLPLIALMQGMSG